MYLFAKFGGHRSYRNGYTNSYMDTLEKANSPPRSAPCYTDLTTGRKTRRRIQAITKRFAFNANAKIKCEQPKNQYSKT